MTDFEAAAWARNICLLAVERKAKEILVEANCGGDMATQLVRETWRELEQEGRTQGLSMPLIIKTTRKGSHG